jgi:hypothetical protein
MGSFLSFFFFIAWETYENSFLFSHLFKIQILMLFGLGGGGGMITLGLSKFD